MKEFLKSILKSLNIYHPLQSFYRNTINVAKKKYYQLTYLRYKGKGFTCNFCNASYEKFIPEYPSLQTAEALYRNDVIAGYGENVFCPNCMSKNRERLVGAVLQNLLPVENTSILHFSPEKNLCIFLKTKARVTSADLLPGFYKTIDPSIVNADATKLHFEDESFDIVIANHVLEHIPEDVKAIKEFYRVLKKGGFAILQVPYSEKLETTIEDPFINDPQQQERLYGQKDHVRIYSLENYLRRLEAGNFTTKVITADSLKQFAVHAIQEKECVILGYK
jgi:SAM-dependent methyltransferase